MVIVHTDHWILRYMMAKKDEKPRMIRWVLLLQKNYFVVKGRKVLRINFPINCVDLRMKLCSSFVIRLKFNNVLQDEQVLAASDCHSSWFADFANYLTSNLVSSNSSCHQRKKFMHDVKKFFRAEPYLYHSCLMRIFVIICLRLRC